MYLGPNIINFNEVDFSEHRSEEVILVSIDALVYLPIKFQFSENLIN